MSSGQRRIQLLIVDDEEKFLESIAKRLRLKDFDVETATNGKDALKVSKRGKFDVAILDLRMPDMDGSEVLKVLKKKHKYLEAAPATQRSTRPSNARSWGHSITSRSRTTSTSSWTCCNERTRPA
jgi:DNA-binding NtrC family response regulator